MKKVFLCLALLVLPALALAASFTSFTLAGDQSSLRVLKSDGSHFDAPKYADQVGFSEPRISADGKHIGWLALYPNCCTSYPIPLALVVLDETQQLHSFDGIKIAVFSWCFMPNARAVGYAQTVVHGSNFQHFEMRAIADGRLLSQYDYPHEDADNALARKRAPHWVQCVPDLFPPTQTTNTR